MSIHWAFALLFAIVIDGCVVCFKVIESLAKKYDIGKAEYVVRVWILVCLGMSSALNATSFIAHAETNLIVVMSIFWAVFLSLVIWGTSFVSIQMLTKRTSKKVKEEKDLSMILREAASKQEQLTKMAELAQKIIG